MTALEEKVLKLPRLQKIGLMEQLWTDLCKDDGDIEIPGWHERELEATEARVREGKEHFEDWTEAKRKVRDA